MEYAFTEVAVDMKRSFLKKNLSAVLCAAVLLFAAPLAASASDSGYTVINPYAAVDWSTTGQFKANLHTHSNVSDGSDFTAMVERHYELGYDILAMTDHATVDRGWTRLNVNPLITFVLNIRDPGSRPTPLTEERFAQISAGADRGGMGMLRVPFGIEHNAGSFDSTHVNSFFTDFGDGYLGGTGYYDYILGGVEKTGGVSFINHPGDYARANGETPENAYNETGAHNRYVVSQFAAIFKKYGSCLGMEIFNMSDRTRNDRILWDKLLMRVVPSGRNIFAFANSDAHSLSGIDTAWEIMCMPSNNLENLRACMEQGAFFACSRKINNAAELARLEAETGLVLGAAWVAPAGTPQPKVTRITVDETADTITVDAVNEKIIHWVADGKVICTGDTIDLAEHAGAVGSYVRAEVWGESGILYTQPFILEYDGAPAQDNTPFFDFGIILHIIEQAFYRLVEASRLLSWLQEMALGA